jgi:hypothetical protein
MLLNNNKTHQSGSSVTGFTQRFSHAAADPLSTVRIFHPWLFFFIRRGGILRNVIAQLSTRHPQQRFHSPDQTSKTCQQPNRADKAAKNRIATDLASLIRCIPVGIIHDVSLATVIRPDRNAIHSRYIPHPNKPRK